MRCLLLAVCVALACGNQDIFVPQTGKVLDVQKVAGTWYPMALVASDPALLNTESTPLRLYVKELRPTAQNGLEITVRRWEDGSCVERKIFAEKTEVPASFQINNQEESNVAPATALEKDNVVPAVALEKGNVAPAVALEKGNVAPAVALEKGKVHVLDTDYQSYVFLCLEAAAAAVPAKQSLTCQYLARTPKADNAVMEQFNRAVKLLSVRASVTFTPAQVEERCRF
ncbi:beta-lactoglobulin [Desmodus rotundus]|uniref:beta-lactoglobulin n=1 Tax=Desmodus rotundus TaxID=9430 RepID=UPI00238158BE|nr:beta-lactoglobulin [Desmodus rotundus]